MNLWLWAALIAFAAIPFLVLPFLARNGAGQVAASRREENLALYNEQAQQYSQQLSAGELDQQQHDKLLGEAQRLLLQNTEDESDVLAEKRGVWLAPLLMLSVPLVSLWLYQQLGAAEDQAIAEMMAERGRRIEAGEQGGAFDRELYRALEKRVEQRPDNVYYWSMLAKGAMDMGNMQQAADYYGRATVAMPGDSWLQAQYAQTLFFLDGNQFTPRVRQAVDRGYALDSENQTVLGLKGIEAYEIGEYRDALKFWRKAQAALQPHSPSWQALQSGINQARDALGEAAPEAVAEGETAVVVQLAFADQVDFDPAQTVFVAVLDASGGPMPIAAKRLQAAQLPLQLVIGDADVLMQGRSLSGPTQLKVVARLSLSGAATPQAGDWVGDSGAFELEEGRASVELTIDHQQP